MLPKKYGLRATSVDLTGTVDKSLNVTLPDLNASNLDYILARDDSVQRFNELTLTENDAASMARAQIESQKTNIIVDSRNIEG